MGAPDLDAMFEEGRLRWPRIDLARPLFDAYVRERAGDGGDATSLHAAELYLACACAHGEPHALACFDEGCLHEVPAFLAGMSASAAFVDEVRQQLRERLFVQGKIRQYSGRGKLSSWLRIVTVRVALNMREQERPHGPLADSLPGAAIDPELAVIQRRYGETYRVALRDALQTLDAEDRSLLRLHYLDGLNIGKIALVFHVSRATIGRRVIEVREKIVTEAWRLLRERIHATPEELESILRVVRSDLDLSLSVILCDL